LRLFNAQALFEQVERQLLGNDSLGQSEELGGL
jgi:hypothetical protein